MGKFVTALFLLLATASSAFAQSVEVIDRDPGGQIGVYLAKYSGWQASGTMVEVRTICNSACTLVLSFIPKERICVTTRAVFGFHAAWNFGENGRAVTNPDATQMMYSSYPSVVKRWISARGGLTPHMIFAKGTSFGYRLCKPNDRAYAQAP